MGLVFIAKERGHDSQHELSSNQWRGFGSHAVVASSLQHLGSTRNIPSNHVARADIVGQRALFSHTLPAIRKSESRADEFAGRRLVVFGVQEIGGILPVSTQPVLATTERGSMRTQESALFQECYTPFQDSSVFLASSPLSERAAVCNVESFFM
jgi:hypothetical protein